MYSEQISQVYYFMYVYETVTEQPNHDQMNMLFVAYDRHCVWRLLNAICHTGILKDEVNHRPSILY